MKTERLNHRPKPEAPQLFISAEVQDIDRGSYYLEFLFQTPDGVKTELVERSLKHQPEQVLKILLDRGAVLPQEKIAAVEAVRAALIYDSLPQHKITRRCGWVTDKTYLNATFSAGVDKERFRLHAQAHYSQADCSLGYLESWVNGLRQPCRKSSYLSFAIGLSFAAPILKFLAESEGAIFNFCGESSTGKGLISRVGQSVFARAKPNDLAHFGMSAAGREQLCYARNDSVVVFDEEGTAEGGQARRREKLRETTFMVTAGKARIIDASHRRQTGIIEPMWRILAISSSENPLETASTGSLRNAGERARHIDIAVPSLSEGGVFDRLLKRGSPRGSSSEVPAESSAVQAKAVEATIAENYGVALQVYVRAIIDRQDAVRAILRTEVDGFVAAVNAADNSWEERFARRFGAVLAGMLLAVDCGVAPWSKAHARRCVKRVYRQARRSVFDIEEVKNRLMQTLGEALQHKKLIPVIEEGGKLSKGRSKTAIGFRRNHRQLGPIIAVDPAWVEQIVGTKAGAAAVHEQLLLEGICLKGCNGKKRYQIAVEGLRGGGRHRWICFDKRKLTAITRAAIGGE